MSTEEDIIKQIKERLELMDKSDQQTLSLFEHNNLVLQEVLRENLPVINTSIGVLLKQEPKNIRDYSELCAGERAAKAIYEQFQRTREDEELELFFKSGQNFNIKKLKEEFFAKRLNKKFPKMNWDKFEYRLSNPLLQVQSYDKRVVDYDPYWVRKQMIAIIQMIYNEMDLYILNIGKEGSGKSAWSSQQILWFYNLLAEVGLIDYAYDITKMFFTDIISFLEVHDGQKKEDYFRIEVLDEGNDLNRGNFRDETNQQFKYEMRTERRMLRIIMINMQQIGELDTSISLSRVNFIYDCKMGNKTETGTLRKGKITMYIIPRGEKIFSDKFQKEFSRNEILNEFAKLLDKKKDYYIGLPSKLSVRDFTFDDIWGFDKKKYDNYIKDEIKKHKYKTMKGLKLSEIEAFMIYEKMIPMKKNILRVLSFQTQSDKKQVKSERSLLNAYNFLMNKITKYFETNPQRLQGMKMYYSSADENKAKDSA